MIPVYYDESDDNWHKAEASNTIRKYKWYDYDSKMWANAVTVNGTNRTTYLNAKAGTIISMEDINAMFVWIPRYKYTYMNKKCSSLVNPNEATNPECYNYVYDDSLYDDLVNELSNYWPGAEDEIISIWTEGGIDDTYTGMGFADYANPDNGATSLDIPLTFMNDNIIKNEPQEIKITFEKGIENTGTIECFDELSEEEIRNSDNNPISEICTDSTNGDLIKGKSTYTHPAFTFGDKELTGIWVGKFETSDSGDNYIIKPDVLSTWDDLSTMFKNTRHMELANNIYGFSQNGTTLNVYTGEISGDSNNLDTHVMKNTEWGAITYLSHSKYGKNSEVFINNTDWLSNYTGRSGGNVGGKTAIKDVYTDQTSTTQFNTYGYYTYDGYLLNYNTNKKSTIRDLNKVSSTAGNIYGVYDMSGGRDEYVMGNNQNAFYEFNPSYAGTWSSGNRPLDKYYDNYTYNSNRSIYTAGRLGDATIEMGINGRSAITWYDDDAMFAVGIDSWFIRGGMGRSSDGSGGLFDFASGSGSEGGGDRHFSSRVVLAITNS